MYKEKRIYPNKVVYYQQHKRQSNIVIRPTTPAPPAPPVNPIDDLADKYGLDRAYSTYADLTTITNTLYISGTKVNIISDIYDDITKAPKIWNAVPIIIHFYTVFV